MTGEIELARLQLANAVAKSYNSRQPRVTSGPNGGQWTSGGGGGGSSGGAAGRAADEAGAAAGIRIKPGRGDVSFKQDADAGTVIGSAHTDKGKSALEAAKPKTALGVALMKPIDAYKFTMAARKAGLNIIAPGE
jgi:hypothetical protein